MASHFGSQSKKLINAFLYFQGSSWLPFTHITAKVSIRYTLRSLDSSRRPLQSMFLDAHTILWAYLFVRRREDRYTIVRLHVRVTSCESHTKTGHCSIHPFVIAQAKHLAKPVPHTTAAKFEFFRYSFAHQQWLLHPRGAHAITPRCFVLAQSRFRLGAACVWHHTFTVDKFVDVMLASALEILKSLVKLVFESCGFLPGCCSGNSTAAMHRVRRYQNRPLRASAAMHKVRMIRPIRAGYLDLRVVIEEVWQASKFQRAPCQQLLALCLLW